ncbi:tRNA uracil 4-sulfurtransferase ThiI [Adlercreutzia sp. ZJ154]|uniref:tRNA uracil 4-sulfurtransferase ThiI n=1 Tax=Adlercreutzia sp. ZJ154 TaxID=2709790 RepID=UPI0013EA5809|nr:tRNA uracil 4-sulfurtransferase ThiI [Adlercreutzia sp. ZJ154]
MIMYQRVILVHYHEIGLKGKNRGSFEQRLLKNLKFLLEGFPVVDIHRISGRLVVFLKEGTSLHIACACEEIIAQIPGVARASCGFKCPRNMDDIGQAAINALAEVQTFETFKVQARRNHTDFEIDSMQINRDIGAILCEAYPTKHVKMKSPDVQVDVEVIQNSAFVYAKSIVGIGGLPVGSSGRVVCLLSSGIDSPVALWRLARRGANCIGVHFSGAPVTSDTSEYLVDDIAHVLEKTGCISRIYTCAMGDYQREISVLAPPPLRVILYRRLMFKTAERIAHIEGARALVTGESLGQVASQTLDNIAATDQSVNLPILRPLIGTDKQEIIAQAQQLGTFEISSQDAPDCCTLFMPRSPETHAKIDAVLQAESEYPLENWVEELASNACVHEYNSPLLKRKN